MRIYLTMLALLLSCSHLHAGGAKVYEIDNYGVVKESSKRQTGLFRPPSDMENLSPLQPAQAVGIVNPQRVYRLPKDKGVPGYVRKRARELLKRFNRRTRAFPQLQIPKRAMADVLVYIAFQMSDAAYVEGALTALPELFVPLNSRTQQLTGEYEDMAVVDNDFIGAVLKHIDSPVTEVRYAALRATRPIMRSQPPPQKIVQAINDLVRRHPDGETRRLGIYALFALERTYDDVIVTLDRALRDTYSLVVLAALQKISWDIRRGQAYPDMQKRRLMRSVKDLERHSDRKVSATAATTQLLLKTPPNRLRARPTRRSLGGLRRVQKR